MHYPRPFKALVRLALLLSMVFPAAASGQPIPTATYQEKNIGKIIWLSPLLDALFFYGSWHVGKDITGTERSYQTFPSQAYDDQFRQWFHDSSQTSSALRRERRAADLSNFGLIGLSLWPVLSLNYDTVFLWLRVHSLNTWATNSLKFSVLRKRPKAYYQGSTGDYHTLTSFPSGHSSAAFALATGSYLLSPELSPWLLFGSASLVGMLRIAGDRHFLTDVLVGAAIGSAAATLSFKWADLPLEIAPGYLSALWEF